MFSNHLLRRFVKDYSLPIQLIQKPYFSYYIELYDKVKGQLKHATQMNSIRQQLLVLLPDAKETFGFITKEHRQLMKLPKEHYYDAVAIACLNNIESTGLINVNFKTNTILLKKCIADGDFQQTKGS